MRTNGNKRKIVKTKLQLLGVLKQTDVEIQITINSKIVNVIQLHKFQL